MDHYFGIGLRVIVDKNIAVVDVLLKCFNSFLLPLECFYVEIGGLYKERGGYQIDKMQLILLFLDETVQDMFDDRYFASFAFPLAEVVNLYEHLEVLFLDGDILLRQLVVVVDEGGASVLVDTEDEAEDEGLAGVL